MKFKFNFIKFLISVFLIFVSVILVYQLYLHLYKAVTTEYAVQISCEETVDAEGYFVRDEQVVYTGNSKYFDVVISNGGKVSKNGTIANVYSTEKSAKLQSQIRELELKIDEYKSVAKSGSGASDTTAYISNIQKDAVKIGDSISSNNPSTAFENSSDFLISVIKHKISIGEITDYKDTIKELEAEVRSLSLKATSATKYLTAPVSGYFSYKTDGIETYLDMSMVDEMTPEVYNNIIETCKKTTILENAIGKVVKGSDWRVCFKSDADKFETVEKGDTLYIRVPSLTNSKIKCTVKSLVKQGDDVYIVLQSNFVTGDLLSQRSCEIEVIIDSYDGLRIDKNALRKIDGKDGVFVKSNGILRYREVELLYIGKAYAVIKYDPIKNTCVQAYDEVVISGSDLYDGKVIS